MLQPHRHCSSLQRSLPCTGTARALYSIRPIHLGKQHTRERGELENNLHNTVRPLSVYILTAADGRLGALSAVGEGVRIALQTEPVSSGGVTGEVSRCVVHLLTVH